MTRKRFVKLCMSQGWQRNDAQLLAARVGPAGSYDRLFSIFEFICTVKTAGVMLADQIGTFSDNVYEALKGVVCDERSWEKVAYSGATAGDGRASGKSCLR